MTKVQSYLASLPEEKRALFAPVYGDVDRFYTVVYLITKNEHLTDLDKPNRYDDRLRMIRQVRSLVEKQLDGFGLDGESVVADIASDYFEDFVNYRELPLTLSNEEFVEIIRRITQS